ncbi:unnamed protein product [Calypogeia fissa]
MAAATTGASSMNSVRRHKLNVTDCTKGLCHKSATICSVSLRPLRTETSLSLISAGNSVPNVVATGPASTWQSSSSRGIRLVPFHGTML